MPPEITPTKEVPMPIRRPSGLPLALGFACALWTCPAAGLTVAAAQQDTLQAEKREPDVHFVPTPMESVAAMLDVTAVGKDDVVYDLGSGDGRIVIEAARSHGARGVGIDIDPQRIAEANHNADSAGVASRVRFIRGDLFRADLRDATVVTLYLLPRLNRELRPKLFAELRPGTRIASNTFDMGAWKPDTTLNVEVGDGGVGYVLYWVLPADAGGTWRLTMGEGRSAKRYELTLEQSYQMLAGTARADGKTVEVRDGRLEGSEIRFALPDPTGASPGALRFTGRVEGDRMEGSVEGGSGSAWTAERSRPASRKPYEVPD
jgi:SAM-dependent methyltransferase